MSQRLAFCVYSGNGVSKLRSFLTDLFNTITEDMNGDDEETEYDDDFDEGFNEVPQDVEMEMVNEGDIDVDEDFGRDFRYRSVDSIHPVQPTSSYPLEVPIQRNLTLRPSQASLPSGGPTTDLSASSLPAAQDVIVQPMTGTSNETQRRSRAFGHQPVIELSTSPTPSDIGSNRSTGTTQSNGAAFFRTYHDLSSSSRNTEAMTPDYVYAEIGHGRGTVGQSGQMSSVVRHTFPPAASIHGAIAPTPQGITQVMHSAGISMDIYQERGTLVPDPTIVEPSVPWPHHEPSSPATLQPGSPDTYHAAPSAMTPDSDPREPEARGRSVKRSLRDTFNAAEHYAATLLFRRGSASNSTSQDGNTNEHPGQWSRS